MVFSNFLFAQFTAIPSLNFPFHAYLILSSHSFPSLSSRKDETCAITLQTITGTNQALYLRSLLRLFRPMLHSQTATKFPRQPTRSPRPRRGPTRPGPSPRTLQARPLPQRPEARSPQVGTARPSPKNSLGFQSHPMYRILGSEFEGARGLLGGTDES